MFDPSGIEKLKQERDVPGLIKELCHEDWRVRSAAALALGRIGDARAVEPLIAALNDQDRHVRWEAADGLAGC